MDICVDRLRTVIAKCNDLVLRHDDIQAVILAGSYARNAQSEASDLDLVVLTDEWEAYTKSRGWLRLFGEPLATSTEYYGLITSIRARYEAYEIEFGMGSTEWISEPVDQGTRRVLEDGYQIIFERNGILKRIKGMIEPNFFKEHQ
jgi:hypothetical protein